MKRLLLITLLTFCSVTVAMAQTETVNVTAEVQNALNYITNPATVEFGNVQSGLQSVVDANPAATADDNASAPQRAEITIENAVSEQFQVSFTDATLGTPDNANTVDFTTSMYVVSGTDSNDDAALTNNANISADGSGDDVVLSIGGTLDAVNAVYAGSYSTSETDGSPVTVTFTLVSI